LSRNEWPGGLVNCPFIAVELGTGFEQVADLEEKLVVAHAEVLDPTPYTLNPEP